MPAVIERTRYLELAAHLRERIRNGELKVGEQLPSYTELYEQHGVSTATIQRACDVLDQENLIERRQGLGIFVAAPQRNLTNTIGIIGSTSLQSQDNPVSLPLMNGIHRAVNEHEQHLLYMGTEATWSPDAGDKVDGVILYGVAESAPILDRMPRDLPRVSIMTSLDGVASIGVDEYRGAQMAVRHMLALGHTRIACLMEKPAWEGRRRYAGYWDALGQAGIEVDPSWVHLVELVNLSSAKHPYLEWARKHMTAWLKTNWSEIGCSAILVQNDVAAIGVIQVLQEAGIAVPEQVSVMGFDGTDICDLISPRLTSVALPLAEMGAKAVTLLNRQISGEESSGETILMPLDLRIGESVSRKNTGLNTLSNHA